MSDGVLNAYAKRGITVQSANGVIFMPSTSKAQKKTMAAIAHGWKPPKGSKVAKIPKKVAKEFNREDKKGKKR